ncbi:MAG: hypothetical protein KTR18_07840 [Acidiferrobacterales bacterium]|nr:hypothetical protein [Acidiferrobacterales bacterium]
MNPLQARLPLPKDIVINFAGMVFLGCAFFLFWTEAQLSDLFTARGLSYLLVGLISCGAVIGWPLTRLHRALSYHLITKNGGEMSESTMQIIRITGTALMLIQLLAVYYLSRMVFFSWPVITAS